MIKSLKLYLSLVLLYLIFILVYHKFDNLGTWYTNLLVLQNKVFTFPLSTYVKCILQKPVLWWSHYLVFIKYSISINELGWNLNVIYKSQIGLNIQLQRIEKDLQMHITFTIFTVSLHHMHFMIKTKIYLFLKQSNFHSLKISRQIKSIYH